MENTGNDSSANTTASNIENTQDINAELKQSDNQEAAVGPKLTKKLKIKIDQQEYDEELPFEVDENNKAQVDYLKRHLQMSKAAAKRMQEASLTRKQAEQFIQVLQNDPMKVLSDPRVMGNEKFQAIAEQFLAKKLQEQMLSPEDRKRIEMEEKLRNYEEQEKKLREDAEHKQIQQLEEHYAQQYQKTIMTALQTSNLPKNPFTVRRMAELMQKNLQHGLDLEPQHLAQLVREDYQKELVSLIGSSEADQIISMFGDDITNKIRKHDLAKFKAGQNGINQPQKQAPTPSQNTEKRKMRPDEYEAYLRSKK